MRHRFCDCADPVVFGHHHDGTIRVHLRPGECIIPASILTSGTLTYTVGGTDRTIPLTGAQLYWGAVDSGQITADTITSGQITAYPPGNPFAPSAPICPTCHHPHYGHGPRNCPEPDEVTANP